jgi:hypothetical protein
MKEQQSKEKLLYRLSYPGKNREQESNLRHAKYFFSTTSFNYVLKGRQSKEFFYSAIPALLPATGFEPVHLLRGTNDKITCRVYRSISFYDTFQLFQE